MFRLTFLTILSLFYVKSAFGQFAVDEKYPKTLWTSSDSFSVKFSNLPFTIPFQVSRRDTTDMGTDGLIGLYALIYFGKDSIRITYKNLPFDEVHWINIQSPKGKTVYRLHFNRTYAAFSQDYIQRNINSIQVEVPEVYELANIIWTLSPSGQRGYNLYKQGEYYNKIATYFKPFLKHPLFKELDFDDSEYMIKYYDFRENSFAFNFGKDNKLVWGRPYYYVNGNDESFNSLFKKLLPLIEDFAQKSNYREFYRANQPYYSQLIKRETELMPLRDMWQWLETEFPDKYNSYKIVFSPLIGASHSTQGFANFLNGHFFSQTVMFVSGPETFDDDKNLNEKQKEGLASGIVFTEIDHNYVNRVSSKYKKSIDSIFSKREIWTSADGDTKLYDSPESVFNEYMTHAVFCLYVLDKFDVTTADFIIKRREALMVERRHYIRFREFDKALTELRNQNKRLKVSELYPKIIEWCRTQM